MTDSAEHVVQLIVPGQAAFSVLMVDPEQENDAAFGVIAKKRMVLLVEEGSEPVLDDLDLRRQFIELADDQGMSKQRPAMHNK